MACCCSVQSTTEKRVATRLYLDTKVCRHRFSLRELRQEGVGVGLLHGTSHLAGKGPR